MLNYFFMYIAIPPRVPFVRLSSTRLYPAICGAIAACAIHVSCTHKMSTSIYASSTYSFKKVSPRMFILPTLMPFVIHFFRLEFSDLFLLRDPFVLSIFLFSCLPSLGYFFSMGGGMWLGRALAGPTPVLYMRWRVHSHVAVPVVVWWRGGGLGSWFLLSWQVSFPPYFAGW
jgi:hypothetical protein